MYPLLNKLFNENAIKNGVALDLGCGSGGLARLAIEKGFSQVDAVDINTEALAKLEAPINPIVSKMEDFKIEPNKYSLIIASYSLQFMTKENQRKTIREMISGLVSGGVAVFNIIGNGDEWADKWPTWTEDEVREFILSLWAMGNSVQARNFNEMRGLGETMAKGLKSWHVFEVVMTKN